MALDIHKATGKSVRLTATKTRINRHHGICHYIVFNKDNLSPDGDWVCYMEKPYPKTGLRPLDDMLKRWADENQ